MSQAKNHSEEINRYLSGKMTQAEAHAFERMALDDPFLQDAIDGAEQVGAEAFSTDVESLTDKILTKQPQPVFTIWKVAAVIALLIVGGFSVRYALDDLHAPQLVQQQKKNESTESPEEILRTESTQIEENKTDLNVENSKEVKTETLASKPVAVLQKRMMAKPEDKPEDKPTEYSVSPETVIDLEAGDEMEDIDIAKTATIRAEQSASGTGMAPVLSSKSVAIDLEEESKEKKGDRKRLDNSSSFSRTQSDKSIAKKRRKEIQSKQISGTVTNNSGEGLAGVNIVIKGTTNGVSTDLDGNYEIEAGENQDLMFSFVGMTSEEVAIDSQTEIDVSLSLDESALGEVVVTALGITKEKASLGYGVSTVDGKVSGKVSDEEGNELPGVSVIVKGTAKSVSTDAEGNYEIGIAENDELIFSSIGMFNQEIKVGARTTLDVQLVKDDQELQEVVVTGFGAYNNAPKGYVEAIPVTGWTDFKEYLGEELLYPEQATGKGVEGRVVLQLTISRIGKITEIEIKKSLGEGCDEEAIRLVKEGPKWKAASRDGLNVETKLRVKVQFELDE